jgi:hypothetical protein
VCGKATSCLDESRILWDPPVGLLQLAIGTRRARGLEDRHRAASKEFGPTRSVRGRQLVKAANKFIVQLDKYFPSGHDHMLQHMVQEAPHQEVSAPEDARVLGA